MSFVLPFFLSSFLRYILFSIFTHEHNIYRADSIHIVIHMNINRDYYVGLCFMFVCFVAILLVVMVMVVVLLSGLQVYIDMDGDIIMYQHKS